MPSNRLLVVSILAVLLLAYPLLAQASPTVVAGEAAGITSLVKIAEVPAPSSDHLLLFVYPLHEAASSDARIDAIVGFYDVEEGTGLYRYYRLNAVEGTAEVLAWIDVDGRPVRPLWLGGPGDRVLIGDTSGGTLNLYEWNLAVGVAQFVSTIELSDTGKLASVEMFRASGEGPIFVVYTVASGSAREYYYAVLDPDTLELKESGAYPVKWYIGGDRDTLYWLTGNITVETDSQTRIIVYPAIEVEDIPGLGPTLFTTFYALVPEPEERVSLLYARFILGELDESGSYVFEGATWGRIYSESAGNISSGVNPSTTLLLALHLGATNKYLATASAWGLLTVSANDMSFYVSTGASAGRLGVFAVIDDDLIVDLAGNEYVLGINEYSLVIRMARVLGNTALLAVQERPTSGSYGSVHFYYATTDRLITDTSGTVAWQEATTTTTTTTSQATQEETTTTTSYETTTTPAAWTTQTRERTTTTTTTTEEAPTTPTATGAGGEVHLKPGDWAVYEGAIEYQGVELPIRIEVEVVEATPDHVTIKYKKIEIQGQGYIGGVGVEEGVTWTYYAGSAPACDAPGLNLFTIWADPSVLPSDGVIQGSEDGLSYKCVYDTRTGLLLEYRSEYEIMGSTQVVHYKLVDSSIELGGGGGGGLPLTLIALAGAGAVVVIVLVLLVRRR